VNYSSLLYRNPITIQMKVRVLNNEVCRKCSSFRGVILSVTKHYSRPKVNTIKFGGAEQLHSGRENTYRLIKNVTHKLLNVRKKTLS